MSALHCGPVTKPPFPDEQKEGGIKLPFAGGRSKYVPKTMFNAIRPYAMNSAAN